MHGWFPTKVFNCPVLNGFINIVNINHLNGSIFYLYRDEKIYLFHFRARFNAGCHRTKPISNGAAGNC